MTPLINDTFAAWTDGLDTRQSMISIFTHIRDMPYSFGITAHDPKKQTEQLLKAGKGSCGPKHYLLAEMFRKLNLSVIYATIPFSWNDPDLRYPPALRKYAAMVPIAHHLACRVQIGCRWVLVDATWDPPLAKGGFPINVSWDGYSEMKWAVKPLRSPGRLALCPDQNNDSCREEDEPEPCQVNDEKNHWDVYDQVRYYRGKAAPPTPYKVMLTGQFYRKFEDWLAMVRLQK